MNSGFLGGGRGGLTGNDIKQLVAAIAVAAEGFGVMSIVTLSADPTATATAAGQGQLGTYGGNLYLHVTAATDTNWLDLTSLVALAGSASERTALDTITSSAQYAILSDVFDILEESAARTQFSHLANDYAGDQQGGTPAPAFTLYGAGTLTTWDSTQQNVQRLKAVVSVEVNVAAADAGVAGGVGQLRYTLPVAAKGGSYYFGEQAVGTYHAGSMHGQVFGTLSASGGYLELWKYDSSGVRTALSADDVKDGTRALTLAFSYRGA